MENMTATQTTLLLKLAEIKELIKRAEDEGARIKIEYSSLRHEQLYYRIQTDYTAPSERKQDTRKGEVVSDKGVLNDDKGGDS